MNDGSARGRHTSQVAAFVDRIEFEQEEVSAEGRLVKQTGASLGEGG